MAKVELKQPVVEEISAGIKDAQSVVLVDYRGLTVEQDTQLRKSLREAGVSYKVYKNTMMNFAFKGTQFEGLSEYLEGPSAMAYSTEDATAPARVLAQFAKTADKLEIKAGVVEGTVYDAKGMAAIANIPSRDVLISKLLGSLQSPDFVTDQAGNSSGNTAGNRELAALGMRNFGKGFFAAFVNIYVRSNHHCAQFFKSENIVDIGIIFGFCPFGQAGADEDRYAAGIFIFNQFGSIIHRRFG